MELYINLFGGLIAKRLKFMKYILGNLIWPEFGYFLGRL